MAVQHSAQQACTYLDFEVALTIQLTSELLPRFAAGQILKKELRGYIQWGAQRW